MDSKSEGALGTRIVVLFEFALAEAMPLDLLAADEMR